MRNVDLNYINVIDIEATCWPKSPPKGEISEIIEIGIAVLNLGTGVIDSDCIFVMPKYSSVSEYCTKLTSITHERLVKEGVSFRRGCRLLEDKWSSRKRVWASYGDYDHIQFKNQCLRRNIQFPFGRTHINIKNLFALTNKLMREVGMKKALSIAGLSLEGTHHRGMDDAVNIAKIFWWILHERHNILPK